MQCCSSFFTSQKHADHSPHEPLLTCPECVSSVSGGGRRSSGSTGAILLSSPPARVRDAPLPARGWTQTAGNHMTKTLDTILCVRNAPTGSQLGQVVFGVFPSSGDTAKSAVNINHCIPRRYLGHVGEKTGCEHRALVWGSELLFTFI